MGTGLLDTLYEECQGYVELRAIGGGKKEREFFLPTEFKKMNGFITTYKKLNIYFAVATRDGGGKKENIVHIPALWCDIDWKNVNIDEVKKKIEEFPLKPTIRVDSGGGWHLYWKLKEPATREDVDRVERIMRGLAIVLDGDMAATDASRILRVPKTKNWKYSPARPVVLQHCNGTTFSLDDFEDLLPIPDATKSSNPYLEYKDSPALESIMQCSFMQHCRDDAATLQEDHWYMMITQLCKETGGPALIHKLSKPYPNYKSSETDRKIIHAINSTGPRTCDRIKQFFDCGKECGVKSPAALAFSSNVTNVTNVTSMTDMTSVTLRDTNMTKRDINVTEHDNCDGVHKQNLYARVREWIAESPGKFSTLDIDKELNFTTRLEKQSRSNALSLLVKEGLIERIASAKGVFRAKNKIFQEMDILGASVEEHPFSLIFGLDNLVEINPKEIILLSGETNSGKTTIIFNLIWHNIRKLYSIKRLKTKDLKDLKTNAGEDPKDLIGIRYFSSEMGPRGVHKKLIKFGPAYPVEEFCNAVTSIEWNRDFQDVIDPDGINFIDYLEVFDGEYYKLAGDITAIHSALTTGIAVIALQKRKGTDIGRGGEGTLEKPRLALAISENQERGYNTVKIIKAKHFRDKNPVGLEKDFIIQRGASIIEVSGWDYAKNHETRRKTANYLNDYREDSPWER